MLYQHPEAEAAVPAFLVLLDDETGTATLQVPSVLYDGFMLRVAVPRGQGPGCWWAR